MIMKFLGLPTQKEQRKRNHVLGSGGVDDGFSQGHVEFEAPVGNTHTSALMSEAKGDTRTGDGDLQVISLHTYSSIL